MKNKLFMLVSGLLIVLDIRVRGVQVRPGADTGHLTSFISIACTIAASFSLTFLAIHIFYRREPPFVH